MKALAILLGLLAFALPARSLDLRTIEPGLSYVTQSCKLTSVTSGTCDLMGYGSVGYSSTTVNANAIGFDYTIIQVGSSSSATFTVSYTTKTYASQAVNYAGNIPGPSRLAGTGAVVVTGPSTVVPTGLNAPVVWHFSSIAYNPYLTFSGLSTSATTYVYIEGGVPRTP